jgi:ketosteroid isomerase-like protein
MPETGDASRSEVEGQVLEAADRLVAAFGEGRVDDYFACFHPRATFVFYTAERRLESAAEWRELWDSLVREEGFEVLECHSSGRRVQELGDAAVFTHDVETRVSTLAGGEETLRERETIVFVRRDEGSWLAVHEHLSPAAG